MHNIQSKYKEAGKNIDDLELKGTGSKIDGIFYYYYQAMRLKTNEYKKSCRHKWRFLIKKFWVFSKKFF